MPPHSPLAASPMAMDRIRTAGCDGHALVNAKPCADGRKRSAPSGPGTALTLVHRLDAGDRDGVALREQVGAEPLRGWHLLVPGVGALEQVRRGPDGEVAGV